MIESSPIRFRLCERKKKKVPAKKDGQAELHIWELQTKSWQNCSLDRIINISAFDVAAALGLGVKLAD
jgi:hypothetical protein